MPNPLFSRFGGGSGPKMPGSFSNFMNMMNQFRQFRNNFQGDPRQQVQNLLDSGQMTQEQFNQLSSMANQFKDMFK